MNLLNVLYCKNCGRELEGRWQKTFCSKHCSANFNNTHRKSKIKDKKFCICCGKELNNSQTKFCSKSCTAKYNNEHRQNTTKGKTKEFQCIKCGQYFEGSIHLSSNKKICPTCKKEISEKKYKKCKFCGKLKDSSNHSSFCSPECRFNSLYIKTLSKYFNINK